MCFILIDWICMDIFLCISLSILRGAVPKPNAYMKMLVGIFAWALLNKTGHFVSLVLLTGLDWDQFITKSWTQKVSWPSSPLKHYLQNFTLNRSTLVNSHSKEKKNDFRWLNMNILNIRDEQSLTFSKKKLCCHLNVFLLDE